MKRISCIGLGRVGQTLMKLFAMSGKYEIGELVVRSDQTAKSAASFISAGKLVRSITEISPSDFIFITTDDGSIGEAARSIPTSLRADKSTVIAHCSGALSSAILSEESVVNAASIHPLKSFASPVSAISTFRDTFCSLEGNAFACSALKILFEDIGAQVFQIDSNSKLLYHIASVFSSNYLHALTSVADKIFASCGVSPELREKIIYSLMSATIENISIHGNKDALTGPVARQETAVLAAHAHVLKEYDIEIEKIYTLLAAELRRV